eukprot:gb/GFBE01079837.1/.p1 GENE.gb/GFBE01079837.1/~~gb/GFBE01079837.1/.p1  ORF type:complete len:254 (+),score=53.66 gb/GFBE01079837.1/:1-762(+)
MEVLAPFMNKESVSPADLASMIMEITDVSRAPPGLSPVNREMAVANLLCSVFVESAGCKDAATFAPRVPARAPARAPAFSASQPRQAAVPNVDRARGKVLRAPPGLEPQEIAPSAASGEKTVPGAEEAFFHTLQTQKEETCLMAVKAAGLELLYRPNKDQMTVLHLAVQRNFPKVAEAVLSRLNVDAITVLNSDGDTALHSAIREGKEALCRAFLQKDSSAALITNQAGETAASLARRLGRKSVLQFLKRSRT